MTKLPRYTEYEVRELDVWGKPIYRLCGFREAGSRWEQIPGTCDWPRRDWAEFELERIKRQQEAGR